MEKFKTIAENNVTINACSKGKTCFCDGSCKITNKYTAEKFEYKEEEYYVKEINNLDRFTPLNNSEMLEDLQGEYVLISSVLNLFTPKNEK